MPRHLRFPVGRPASPAIAPVSRTRGHRLAVRPRRHRRRPAPGLQPSSAQSAHEHRVEAARLERFPIDLHHRDCVRKAAGEEWREAGAAAPLQASRRRPAAFLAQPLRGGPILPRGGVPRQSRCTGIAPSSLLATNQNRLRHNGADRSETALAADSPTSVRTDCAPRVARAHAGLVNLDRVTGSRRGMGADDCSSIK